MSVKELFDLTGKTAAITGATRSLGAAMALALAEAGADIISIQVTPLFPRGPPVILCTQHFPLW